MYLHVLHRTAAQVSPAPRAWDALSSNLCANLACLALHMPLNHTVLGRLSSLSRLTALEFTAAGRGRRGDDRELLASLSGLSALTALKHLRADGPSWPGFRAGGTRVNVCCWMLMYR
jgi:hypothetical protein